MVAMAVRRAQMEAEIPGGRELRGNTVSGEPERGANIQLKIYYASGISLRSASSAAGSSVCCAGVIYMICIKN